MSGINGDKARFNRRRKQKIQRRLRQMKMFGSLPKAAETASAKSREKSA
jgi:hypothetical protein